MHPIATGIATGTVTIAVTGAATAWSSAASAANAPGAEVPPVQVPPVQVAPAQAVAGASHWLGQALDAARLQLRALAAAIPDLPVQIDVVRATLAAEVEANGRLALLGPVLAFVLLGGLAEGIYRRATAGLRRRLIALPVDSPEARMVAVGWRTLYGLGLLLAFAAGSVGAFLALDWPPLLQDVVLTYLLVFLAVRLTLVLGRIVLAPGAERFRLLPIATATARYWFAWSAVLIGAFVFAKGTFRLVAVLGASPPARTLIGIALGAVLLALSLTALWRRPAPDGARPAARGHEASTWLVSLALMAIWLTAFTGAVAPFDLGVTLLLLALASLGLHRAVAHLLRPAAAGTDATDAVGGSSPAEPIGPGEVDARAEPGSVAVAAFERGLRILLVAGGALVIARILDLDLIAIAADDRPGARLVRGVIDVVFIALVADFAWGVARAWIDRSVSRAGAAGTAGTEDEQRHRQRLRTLLPILRNLILITLLVVAGLTALASLGVEVGPLVAGAGVVGIAVGLGAQTLVKDVIAGLFFLFDDAFRVGEYIESGRIKGTVEAFSLRSVKLRHHRGPLHTVPFGALTTITNYSRDWVIDKLTLGLTYDTDLAQVKRIVREIGRRLAEDPDFAPHILEPLKMQGVDAFGDFAIQVRLKMMTRPGEQFVIRRQAYAMIKQAFDAQGIRFAYPTVSVAGGDPASAAAGTVLRGAGAEAGALGASGPG